LEVLPAELRVAGLKRIAADAEVEWIVVVDEDAVLAADAFGSLRRSLDAQTAIVGGRAHIGASQRLGGMFGPARSGPDPFELLPLIAMQTDRQFTDFVRGPIDAPQRGAFVVAADFVRSLSGVELDSDTLHLDLAVHARAAERAVVCEPSLLFAADEDSLELRQKLLNIRRYAGTGTWQPQDMHRDPPRLRSAMITREARVMGNIRGYARRPYPPCDVLVLAADEMARARAQRGAAAVPNAGVVTVCEPADGDAARRALARTGDRYLLVTDAAAFPDRAGIEALAERLERNGRIAVALEGEAGSRGAALFHSGRIVNGGAYRGSTVAEVVADAVASLPQRRLFANTAAGDIVPDVLPVLPGLHSLDVIYIAASKPVVTQQSVQALMGEPVNGTITVVYPAGATTTERLLATYSSLRLAPDASDVQLAVGLNRALAACTSDAVAILRDDTQIPHGFLARLMDAFRRIPRLGAAVPRVGGAGRPESVPDLGYRNVAEMQTLADRRYEAFAREALLLDFATAPAIVVSREALEVVGGFDETFGFSRVGVEDFTRRLRAANFLIARCDDAYAHMFPQVEAASFVGNLDDAPFLRAAYEKRWQGNRGFDPERDRVGLRTDGPAEERATQGGRVRVLVPLGDPDEWLRAQPVLADLAVTFRAGDAVDVAIGLDGTFGIHAALAAVRELLLSAGVPMEETLNVSIDFTPDVAEWRDAGTNNVRIPGITRDALAELPMVHGAEAVRALFPSPIA